MNPTEEDLVAALKDAQGLMMQGRFDEASAALERVLAVAPDHAEALYMAAVSARYEQRFDAARALLARLRSAAPDFGRGFQEEGHLHRDLGETEKALNAYMRAVEANPGLEASWRAQGALLDAAGRNR